MKAVACENGSMHHVFQIQASKLKEVMANYFVYLASGLAPPTGSFRQCAGWTNMKMVKDVGK